MPSPVDWPTNVAKIETAIVATDSRDLDLESTELIR